LEGKYYKSLDSLWLLAKLRLKPTRLSPGMAIPLKAISIAFCGGVLIFEGLRVL